MILSSLLPSIKNKTKILLFIFAACSFQAQPGLAKYSEGDIKGTFHFLKPEYAYLFIAYGNIVSLPSGILETIRFKGNYGPQNDIYKCHWQITNPGQDHQSTADHDCPLDGITSLIQNFFPSPVGEPPLTVNISNDFISNLKAETLGRILHFITKNKMNLDLLSSPPELALEIYKMEYPDSYTNSVTKYQEQVRSRIKKATPPATGAKKAQKSTGKEIGLLKGQIAVIREKMNNLSTIGESNPETRVELESLIAEKNKLESNLAAIISAASNQEKKKKAQLTPNVSMVPMDMKGLISFIQSGQSKDFARSLELAKILIAALYETQSFPERYPPYIVEHTLLAFFWNRFATKDDLKALYEGMGPEMINAKWSQDHKIIVDEDWKKATYSFEDYTKFKQTLANPTPGDAVSLLENTEFLMFLTMAFNLYEAQFPPMLVTNYTDYPAPKPDIPSEDIETYKDCGESSLRNFFNAFAYNVNMGGIFDVERLKRMFPNLKGEIVEFFLRQTTGNLEQTRAEWGALLANIPDASYCNVHKHGARFEINQGLANMLTIIRHLVNDPELNSLAESAATVIDSLHPQLLRLCQMLSQSQSNMKVTYNLSGPNDRGDMYLTFSINGKKTYTWTFLGDHFAFRPFNEGSANDWRNATAVWQEAILSSPDLMTKGYATLLPLFMKDKDLFYSYINKNPGLAALNIYTMPLNNLKDYFAALTWGFKNKFHKDLGLEGLSHRWVETLDASSLEVKDQVKVACLMTSYGRNFNLKNFPQSVRIAQAIEKKATGEWSQELSSITEELTYNMPMCLPLFSKIVALNPYENLRTKQPFAIAAKNHDLPLANIIIDKALQFGHDLNKSANMYGHTFLDEAIDSNALEIVELLVQKGADINHLDSQKKNPLYKAILKGPQMVDLLLKLGALVNLPNADYDPFEEACSRAPASVVNLLLQHGAQKDAPNKQLNTPLHIASINGQIDTIKLLLNPPYDVQVDPLNNENNTPLHQASKNGHFHVITYLIEKGANVNAVNIYKVQTGGWGWGGGGGTSSYEDTPLHLAARGGHEKAVAALLTNPEILVNKLNGEHETPLILSLRHRNPNLVQLLLNQGADPTIKDKGHKNALDIAKGIFSNDAVIQVLEQHMMTK